MSESKEKVEYEVICPEVEYDNKSYYIYSANMKKILGRPVKAEMPWKIPTSEEEAKELYGENCTMEFIFRTFIQQIATRPNYQAFFKDALDEDLSEAEAATKTFRNTVEVFEANTPRKKTTKKVSEQDAISVLAAKHGVSADEILAYLDSLK